MFLKTLLFLSVENLESDKEGTGLGRSVEITGVAVRTFIQVFLEGIENVLHTAIEL